MSFYVLLFILLWFAMTHLLMKNNGPSSFCPLSHSLFLSLRLLLSKFPATKMKIATNISKQSKILLTVRRRMQNVYAWAVVLLKHDTGIWFHFWWKFNLLMVALKLYFMRDLRLILYPQPYSWVWVKMWWVSHSFCLSHLKQRTKECISDKFYAIHLSSG